MSREPPPARADSAAPEGIGRDDFDEIRALVYARSGITLGEGKQALVSARVGKRMRSLGLEDFGAYLAYVKGEGGEEEVVHLLDAISTNVTSFFREPAHFDFIRDEVRGWLAAGQRRFRFWSAASSTGEEPYTLAMTLADLGADGGMDARILATDISTRVLREAQRGIYPAARAASVPADRLSRHFLRVRDGETEAFEARASLREMVVFRRLNLALPPFPMKGPMDVILCRNVMIYFDARVRERLVAEFHRLLKPGGYLLIGHTESLTGLSTPFRPLRPSIYRKAGP